MANSGIDPYALCPCGSGKKVKFCCLNVADDMIRIDRALEGNQVRQALSQLETLHKKHPTNTWVGMTRAIALLSTNDVPTAREVSLDVLRSAPDHEQAMAVYAISNLRLEGMSAAQKSVQRAFQKSSKNFPEMCSLLADLAASEMLQENNILAAREYVSLSLRLAEPERRQTIFRLLLQLDGENSAPAPLRSVHPLPELPSDLAGDRDLLMASKYALLGCFAAAADVLANKQEALAHSGEFWHMYALCKAWANDLPTAATAFHRAAEAYGTSRLETAIDCETLSQLLCDVTAEGTMRGTHAAIPAEEVSRVLSRMDEVPQFERLPSNSETVAGSYRALNREPVSAQAILETPLEKIPQIRGMVMIQHQTDDASGKAQVLLAAPTEELAKLRDEVSSLVGKTLEFTPEVVMPKWDRFGFDHEFHREYSRIMPAFAIPENCAEGINRALNRRLWSEWIIPRWLDMPQAKLRDRSPRELAKDPGQQIMLSAAVQVLDAYANQWRVLIDIDGLRGTLGLPQPKRISLTEEQSLHHLTLQQLMRLEIDCLNKEQLASLLHRASAVQVLRLLLPVYQKAVTMDKLPGLQMPQLYNDLVMVYRDLGRLDDAARQLEAFRLLPAESDRTFHEALGDMLELTLMSENPQDERLPSLVGRLREKYRVKLPKFLEYLQQFLEGINRPDLLVEGIAVSTTAAPSAGLWTPEASVPASPVAESSGYPEPKRLRRIAP